MMSDPVLIFAADLAATAARLAQGLRQNAPADFVSAKGEKDFITQADRAVETMIRAKIQASFPAEPIFGEEEGGDIADACWIVDPIDGTTNYLKGLPDWGVCLARVQAGEITHGVTVCPDLGLVAQAVKGGGAWLNDKPIHAQAAQALPLVEIGFSPRCDLSEHLSQITRVLAEGADYRRSGAACIGLLRVAAGWSDVFYERHLHLWDAAVGLLLVRESGGSVRHSDLTSFADQGSPVLAVGCAESADTDRWARVFDATPEAVRQA